MKRLLQYFLSVVFIVGFSFYMTSCDKDDEPKLSAKHSMILGNWYLNKYIYKDYIIEADNGYQDLAVDIEYPGEIWKFSEKTITIINPAQSDSDTFFEYRYDESENTITLSNGLIYNITKLNSDEMTLVYDYREPLGVEDGFAGLSMTGEFARSRR